MIYGYNFAKRQCDWLGIDWRSTLESLSQIEQFKIVRLGIYWHEVEEKQDHYDFSQIESELEILARSDQKAIVTIGMKAPRWPEFYIPNYVEDKINKNLPDVTSHKFLRERCIKFIKKAIKKLDLNETIVMWQIENEPLDPQHPIGSFINLGFLLQEIAEVKRITTKRICVNFWGNDMKMRRFHENLIQVRDIDEIGIDLYPRQARNKDDFLYFLRKYKGPDTSVGELKTIINDIKIAGKKPFIAELQAEPWENFDFRKFPEKVKSISIKQLKKNIQTYKALEFEFILLWGLEYWIYAKKLNEIPSLLI